MLDATRPSRASRRPPFSGTRAHRTAVLAAAAALGTSWWRAVDLVAAERHLLTPGLSLLFALGATGLALAAGARALGWAEGPRRGRSQP
jgi:hypothetical protein